MKNGGVTHQTYRETGIYNGLKVWLAIESSPGKIRKTLGKNKKRPFLAKTYSMDIATGRRH